MPKINDKGQLTVKLPFAGNVLTFKRPTGRTIDQVAQFARRSQVEGSETSEAVLFASIAAQLCTSPLTTDDVLDFDADDYMEVVEALKTFRIFQGQV